jgi:hypothetical protein
VCALCARTVESCCAQTGGDFRVVIVCNEAPPLPYGLQHLTVIRENFPVPRTKDGQLVDKYRKIQRGLIHARPWVPFHWSKVDADDCVSNRLSAFVAKHAVANGWIFRQGFVYTEGAAEIYLERRNFHQVCGTSSILRCEDLDLLPTSMDQAFTEFEYLRTPHGDLTTLVSQTTPLAELPFPGAVYCTGTGENWSEFGGVGDYRSIRWTIRRLLNLRRLTPRIRREFSLRDLNVCAAA